MNEFIVKAPAKVNLSLDVVKKREDGYHEMRMINHSIALSDILSFKTIPSEIKIQCDNAKIPTDQNNLVHKVATKIKQQKKITDGVLIDIQKNIPSEAGLAGGSTDGAATILGLNALWQLNMSLDEMYRIGRTIGADIPYCCFKGMALVQGIGEKITPIKPMKRMKLLVVKPEINIATPWAFSRLDKEKEVKHPNIDRVIHCIETEDYTSLQNYVGNTFEQVVFKEYPSIRKIKETMLEKDASLSIMSGSGSTVIGYFESDDAAEKAYDYFKQKYEITFRTEIE